MSTRPTYRGEVLADLAKLTDSQIADRVRHAVAIDRAVSRLLRRYRAKHQGDEAAGAAVDAVQVWADVGTASIAAAENRREVSIFTRTRSV